MERTQLDFQVVDESKFFDTREGPAQPCRVVMTYKIDPWTRMVLDWEFDLIKLDSCEGPGDDC